ncbi:MAG: protein kinase, partial [Planctomycetes bacterium]|nr:protein kinase [Planctomycetota bacterium]
MEAHEAADTIDELVEGYDQALAANEMPAVDPRMFELSPAELDELLAIEDCVFTLKRLGAKAKSGETRKPRTPHVLPTIPGYEIKRVIGHGGMGIVYEAVDCELHRTVALKMVLGGGRSHERRERFLREMQAIASLEHPNIVRLYDGHQAGDQMFFTLEYVDGGTLADALNGKPQPFHQAAEMVILLARAIHYAHGRGVIHRDLKPGNVLCQRDGTLKISDFGLAKIVHEEIELTKSSQWLGTPCYMAPEQASGTGDIGPAADIYALGAILYEMLTGRPPFLADSSMAILDHVRNEDPLPVGQHRAGVPRDLETICMKCLSKEPEQRYATAEALADDLQRFLANEPILARPPGTFERGVKWAKRHPTWCTTLCFLFVMLIATPAVTVMFWLERERTAEAANRARQEQYFRNITLADRDWRAGNIAQVEASLAACPDDLRHWEWRFLHNRVQACDLMIAGQKEPVGVLAFSEDGSQIFTAQADGTIRFHDADTGAEIRRIACPLSPIYRLRWLPRSKRFVTFGFAEGQPIHLCDLQTGKTLRTFKTPAPRVESEISVDPHERRLAAVSTDGRLAIWDIEDGQVLGTIPIPRYVNTESFLNLLAFHPVKYQLALAQRGKSRAELNVWDIGSTKVVQALSAPGLVYQAVCFAHDGKLLAAVRTAGDNRTTGRTDISLFDPSNGALIKRLHGHTQVSPALAFTPDGKRLASGGADNTVRVWTIDSEDEPVIFRAAEEIIAVAFDPRKPRVAVLFKSGAVRAWNYDDEQGTTTFRVGPGVVNCVSLSPDGRYLAAGRWTSDLLVWDRQTKREWFSAKHEGKYRGILRTAFSPDSKTLATASKGADVNLWDVPAKKMLTSLPVPNVRSIAFSPDGTHIALGDKDGSVTLWDWQANTQVRAFAGHTGEILDLAFHPDGREIASSATDRTLRRWDATTGNPSGIFDTDEIDVH